MPHWTSPSSRWAASAGASSVSGPMPTSSTSTAPNGVEPQRANELAHAYRRGAADALRGPPRAARPRHRSAPRGPQWTARPLARVLRRVLPPLVAVVGGAGTAARARCRRQRQADRRVHGASPTRCATRTAPDPQGLREIKRIKARVENERLPQGADPVPTPQARPRVAQRRRVARPAAAAAARARRSRDMRTTSTIGALDAAHEAGPDRGVIRRRVSRRPGGSRAGSARPTRCCPARPVTCSRPTASDSTASGDCLEYPPRSASQVEEDYLGATRRARRVFEQLFYGG